MGSELDLQTVIKEIKLEVVYTSEDLSKIDIQINQERFSFLDARNRSELSLNLRSIMHHYIQNNYSSVIVHHACRCTNENAYRRDGIRASSRARQRQLAKQIFHGLDVEKGFRNTGCGDSGSVGVLFFPDTNSHYLKGSEFIQQIAAGIGSTEAQQRLEKLGIPTLIKCIIPLGKQTTNKDKFEDPTIGFLYTLLVIQRLVINKKFNKPPNQNDGVTLIGDILPENIQKFVQVPEKGSACEF